ncbi:unnamed protein product [Paramecium octaurelia]|uniref:Uncharacterized protein n=1 Tax=Paramecium octaurelia TaxID=43137 RepID=A0A8S1RUQ8_PAROT|nr:unnamed protein product [Paramecium octaurelia]
MKNILLTALLVAIVAASLRGSDRKEHGHHRDQYSERQGTYSNLGEEEYVVYESADGYYTLYNSEDKYTLYESDDSDDKYTLYDSDQYYPLYNSDQYYTLYDSEDSYSSSDIYEEYIEYDSESSSSSSDSSSDSESESQEYEDRRNYHTEKGHKFERRGPRGGPRRGPRGGPREEQRQGREGPREVQREGPREAQREGPREGPRGGRFHIRDQKNNDKDHPRPHRPQDEFPRQVFQNLRKTGKVILDEWNITEDPSLKNEIRAVLIGNLENLLPVAEVLIPTEVASGPAEPINVVQREHHPHPHPPPPPPPQPEDEFARQVFETLHQIGFEILEQWRIEQDVEVKNQIRANLIQQLSDLIPAQSLEVSTTILDNPLQLEIEQVHPTPRLADENGN